MWLCVTGLGVGVGVGAGPNLEGTDIGVRSMT